MMKTSRLAQCGMIAAIYTVLTLALQPIGFGIVQFRLGEAMCVLPFFMPSAATGLTLGCFVSNAIGAAMGATTMWDVLFGTLATAISAYAAVKIRREWLVPLPAVLSNAVIIGAMLTYMMTGEFALEPLFTNMLIIGISQMLSCYGLGIPLLKLLKRIGMNRLLPSETKNREK